VVLKRKNKKFLSLQDSTELETPEEVRQTIEMGQISPAKSGRMKYEMLFSYGDFRGLKFCGHKHIEVYCVNEGEDIIVITVVVKYF